MSNHERWVVYPLLFLSLGAALRPKFTGELTVPALVTAPHVQCEALTVVDRLGKPHIEFTAIKSQPRVVVYGPNGQVLFNMDTVTRPLRVPVEIGRPRATPAAASARPERPSSGASQSGSRPPGPTPVGR